MPFVQGKCESCGGILTVDPSLKAANCPFCGSAYVVQDSINYYNTTIKVESMHADVVNVSDESSSEGRLKAANAYMKLGKYEKAEIEYKKVTELTPQNYLGWLGLIESHTQNYTLRIRSTNELNKLKDYSKSVIVFAPTGTGEELAKKCNIYIDSETEKNKTELEPYSEASNKYKNNMAQIYAQEQKLNECLNEKIKRANTLAETIKNYEEKNKKLEVNRALVIVGIFLLVSGLIICAINVFVGILFILIGGLPLFFVIRRIIQNSNRKNEYSQLMTVINDLEKQIREAKKQKETNYLALLSTQKEVEKYN